MQYLVASMGTYMYMWAICGQFYIRFCVHVVSTKEKVYDAIPQEIPLPQTETVPFYSLVDQTIRA